MKCRECGAELPEDASYCLRCGASQGPETARAGGCGKSELVAMLLSFFIPGGGLLYLGDRKLALCILLPSIALLALLFLLDGSMGNGYIGIQVDSAPGLLVLAAMFVLWLFGNYKARKLWEDMTGCGPLL